MRNLLGGGGVCWDQGGDMRMEHGECDQSMVYECMKMSQ